MIPDATTEPDAYVAALLALVGTRDPVGIYEKTVALVGRECELLTSDDWYVRLAPDEWNSFELLGHLADVDIVYGFRLRLVLTGHEPTYPGYDEKAWALLPKEDPDRLLERFRALRRANLELIRSLAPQQLSLRGVHSEQGPEDIERMILKLAGHDLAHLDQLSRTVNHARSTTVAPNLIA